VVRTTDGGNTWAGTTVSITSLHLEYIQFLSTSVGYTSGPGGMFKSTDGGATWLRLTMPPAGDTISIWGAWFRSESVGWVCASNCRGRPTFYRTTDGGASFAKFEDTTSTVRVRLSDPYKPPATGADTVYAIGDRSLWMSTDDGQSFARFATTDTSAPWIEELAMFGNSVLLPLSTGDCGLGSFASGGGMMFSTNKGSSWNRTLRPFTLFGSCLLSATSGWVAGFGPTVEYTSTAGATWQARQCGIDNGKNTDDIFFLNDSTGWVVGDGIYRYTRARRALSDSTMVFPDVCADSTMMDTVYITNQNFGTSAFTAQITGADAALFTIANGPLPAILPSCAAMPIVVRYSARQQGAHTAQLRISIQQPDTTLFVDLRGSRRTNTTAPDSALVVLRMRVNPAGISRSLQWRAARAPFEQISSITQDSGSTAIALTAPLPLTVSTIAALTFIQATPTDTGTIAARFRVRLDPCKRDTVVRVRVYATSGIINSIGNAQVDAGCSGEDTLRIPIRNSGNDVLEIRTLRLSGQGVGAFTVLGYTSGAAPTNARSLPPLTSDTVLIRYRRILGDETARLHIDNNDATTARGDVDPYDVDIRGVASQPAVEIADTTIDGGVFCVGDRIERDIRFFNAGVYAATIRLQSSNALLKGVPSSPFVLSPGATRATRVTLPSSVAGTFVDTVWVTSTPCDVRQRVLIQYSVAALRLTANPVSVVGKTQIGIEFIDTLQIGFADAPNATLQSITIDAPPPGMLLQVLGTLPRTLQQGETVLCVLRYSRSTPALARGSIVATATGVCTARVSVPFDVLCESNDVRVSKLAIDLEQECLVGTLFDTLFVQTNHSNGESTLEVFLQGDATLVADTLWMPAEAVDSPRVLRVIVRYQPSAAGSSVGRLRITDPQSGTTIEIPINARTRVSVVTLDPSVTDAGILETCEGNQVVTTQAINSGDLLTELHFESSSEAWLTPNSLTYTLPPGASTSIPHTINVAALPTGVQSAQVTYVDARCSTRVVFSVVVQKQVGALELSPSLIDIGAHPVGAVIDTFVFVTNATPIARTVSEFFIEPDDHWSIPAAIAGTQITGTTVQRVPIRYSPSVPGAHQAVLTLVDVDRCTTRVQSTLRGSAYPPAPPVRYTLKLTAGHYRVTPNQTFPISIDAQNTFDNTAQIDSLHIVLQLPEYLVQLGTVTATAATNLDIESTLLPNNQLFLNVVPTGQGALAGVSRLALLNVTSATALPDSVPITFMHAKLFTSEDVLLSTEDGSVFVDMCGPRLGVLFLPTTELSVQQVVDNGRPMVVTSSSQAATSIPYTLYSVDGTVVADGAMFIQAGRQTTIIPVDVPSGVYVFECKSSTGSHRTLVLVL
jgi:photosystem II stability/assembly factor-like uncharacterized protein